MSYHTIKPECANGLTAVQNEDFDGAKRFAEDLGRHGDFDDI
tara:strand:+ start:495 stop:620 length:126 start_codon:yes stop_codon:yes gene_type:complete